MAERSRKSAEVAAYTTGLSDFNSSLLKALEHNRAMVEKMAHAVQEESLKFINLRLKHTANAIESARDCQGISGLMAVHNEWLSDLARDYTEQSRHLGEIVRELAEDNVATTQEVIELQTRRVQTAVEEARAAAE